jgi:tetratricopeptide (TPR) repeat protein
MDGRHIKKLFVAGGIALSTLGCTNKNTYPNSMLPQNGTPPAGQSGLMGAKSPVMSSPGLETTAAAPRKKGPLSPEFEVAMADTRLQVAMADPPPPNRDELLDSVRACYQRALKQNPKHKEALLGLARMYSKLGDKDHAAEIYQKYLKYYPKDAEVLHEVAMRRAQWKDWPGAVSSCEAALKLDPENRTYRKTLGFCQARAGQYDAALANLQKVMPEAQARHNLAGIMDHMGQAEASRQQLQLALQADPGYAPAKEFLNELLEPKNGIQQAGFTEPK